MQFLKNRISWYPKYYENMRNEQWFMIKVHHGLTLTDSCYVGTRVWSSSHSAGPVSHGWCSDFFSSIWMTHRGFDLWWPSLPFSKMAAISAHLQIKYCPRPYSFHEKIGERCLEYNISYSQSSKLFKFYQDKEHASSVNASKITAISKMAAISANKKICNMRFSLPRSQNRHLERGRQI